MTATAANGFASRNEAVVPAPPGEAWEALVRPGEWWSSDHTYSGDARNMTLAPTPGGCFCETVPAGSATPPGSLEHMRVIYAAPGSLLRLSGALGPLQAEALTGTLTVTLEPEGDGTRIVWEYVVGGYARVPLGTLAPLVDAVMGEQLQRLSASLEAGPADPG